MDLLAQNLLTSQPEVDDIPLDSPAVAISSLPFPNLTTKEVSKAILSAGNTTLGNDQILTAILRLAWPHILATVLDLFQKCLDIDHHPKDFRIVIVAIIAKTNKADMTSPRSYRPIALLSVLGKGLERLVAKRKSWIAIKFKVLFRQQFGAFLLRSSVDLTTCFTHDFETALSKGETATLATLDVKGAFDAVLPGRLVRRLREQGWPAHLCSWATSFLTKREIRIRLDGKFDKPRPISCGVPQGSPVLPILFMLYIAPIFKIEGLQKSFGYANEIVVLEISASLQENSNKISATINDALAWGTKEGIIFDPGKSELLHFSRKHRDKGVSPHVHTSQFSISENPQKPFLKWLGVHFDKRLTFKQHITIQAAKALKVAHALRCIGNTARGISPSLSRQVVITCVLPIAHFAAATWWPGKTRMKRGKQTSNRVGSHISTLDKVHAAAARTVLPVFSTTPTIALLREARISPAEIALDNITRRAALRMCSLDPYY